MAIAPPGGLSVVTYRIPEHVGRVEDANGALETLYLARLPDGPIVVLQDTALTIWQEAVEPSGDEPLAHRVAAAYGVQSVTRMA